MLAVKLLQSTPQEWFGRGMRQIHDADLIRFLAAREAAKKLAHGP